MYEIVVRFRQREEVIESVDNLEIALWRVQVYKRRGLTAYFRPSVRRMACIQADLVHHRNVRDVPIQS